MFESYTIAQIIADKLEREGFAADILDQEFQTLTQIPFDRFRLLMGMNSV